MITADDVSDRIWQMKKIFAVSRKAKVSDKLSQMIDEYFPSKGLVRKSLNKVSPYNRRT